MTAPTTIDVGRAHHVGRGLSSGMAIPIFSSSLEGCRLLAVGQTVGGRSSTARPLPLIGGSLPATRTACFASDVVLMSADTTTSCTTPNTPADHCHQSSDARHKEYQRIADDSESRQHDAQEPAEPGDRRVALTIPASKVDGFFSTPPPVHRSLERFSCHVPPLAADRSRSEPLSGRRWRPGES